MKKGPAPKLYTHDGITLDLAGWAARLGTTKDVLKNRLSTRIGWTVERALTEPQMRKGTYKRRKKLVAVSAEQIFRMWAASPRPDTSTGDSPMTEQEYRELEPLYDQAKAAIPTWPHISISRVQRTYTLGYNRAANLLEHLAEYGALHWDRTTGSFSPVRS